MNMEKYDNIRAVAFDLDNTLSDRKYTFSCHASRMADLMLGDSPDEVKKRFAERLIVLDNNGYAEKTDVWSTICSEFGVISEQSVYMREWNKNAQLFSRREPYAEELLEYLSGKYILALLTNGRIDTQSIKLDGIGFRKYFSTVMISGETDTAKPDTRIYLMLCERLGVSPSQTLYIGDHLENDIRGPLSAGMKAILYDRYDTYGGIYPETISSLKELEKIL